MEFKHQNVQEVDLMHPKGGPNDSGCNCTINANYGIIYFGYAYNWDSNCINDNPEMYTLPNLSNECWAWFILRKNLWND